MYRSSFVVIASLTAQSMVRVIALGLLEIGTMYPEETAGFLGESLVVSLEDPLG